MNLNTYLILILISLTTWNFYNQKKENTIIIDSKTDFKSGKYPEESIKNEEEGIVKLEVIVDENDKIEEINIIERSNYERLNKVAYETTKNSKFESKKDKNGKKLKTRFKIIYKFSLN